MDAMSQTFVLEYWQDDGWYVGRLKEIPGAFSQGGTLEEREENVRNAYQLMMAEDEQPSRPGIQVTELTPEAS